MPEVTKPSIWNFVILWVVGVGLETYFAIMNEKYKKSTKRLTEQQNKAYKIYYNLFKFFPIGYVVFLIFIL